MINHFANFNALRFRYIITLSITLLTGVSLAIQPAQTTNPDTSRSLWSTGDESGVYLVLAWQQDQQNGFYIFYRPPAKEEFLTSQWYQGQPASVTVREHNLLVFLNTSRCFSYDMYNNPRTQRRLPPELLSVSAVTRQNKLYVLALAQQPASVPLLISPSIPDSSAPTPDAKDDLQPDSNQPAKNSGIESTVFVETGNYLVLKLTRKNRWYSLSDHPLTLAHWEKPSLVVCGDKIRLFGLDNSPLNGNQKIIAHCRLEKGHCTAVETLPLDDVLDFTALAVNRGLQLRVIAGVSSFDSDKKPDQSNSPALAQFHVGWPTDTGWHFSSPLEKQPGTILLAPPNQLSFAAFDQNIAAFESLSPRQILFGVYSAEGKIVQDIAQPVGTVNQQVPKFLLLFFSPYIIIVLIVIVFLSIFWRRADAFGNPPALPDCVMLAPLLRRVIAFILDTIPPFLVPFSLFADRLPPQDVLLDQMQQNYYDPVLLKFLGLFYLLLITYFAICEIILSATPGKMALHLIVLNNQGYPITIRQALVRNLFRFIELYRDMPFIALVVTLISKRRQRIGDLAARTIVVVKTPALQDHLLQCVSNPPSSANHDEALHNSD